MSFDAVAARKRFETVEPRHAESVVSGAHAAHLSFMKADHFGAASVKKRGLTVEPAVPEEHPFQELLSAWIG